MSQNLKLIDKWLALLPRDARRAIPGIIATADAAGAPLWLVGGPVRDLILDRPSHDVDLVTEADAIPFATRAAHYLDAPLKTHPSFGTATITIHPRLESADPPRSARPDVLVERAARTRADPTRALTIDIATARTETYAHPGALPKVRPATVEEDLRRRDFTINAIALRLNGPNRGELLDPAGGRSDLETRLIRTLHNRSFQDDPTRNLRAARYAARLDFRIEPRTLRRLKRDTTCLDRISAARLHHEFARIFDEAAPETTLTDLDRLGSLSAIHPALHFDPAAAAAFRRLRSRHNVGQGFTLPTAARASYWPVLASRLTSAEAAALATRMALTKAQRAAVEAMPRLRDLGPQLHRRGIRRSGLAELLVPFPLPALWALAATTTQAATRVRLLDYLTAARHVHPALRGDDLIALGVPEGPAVGDMLHRLRAAKLDGEVKTKRDEIRVVREILSDEALAKAAPSRSS